MKKLIVNFLVFLLSKLDPQTLKHCIVDKTLSVRFQKYVPNDNKWYHVGYTISFSVKRNNKKISKKGKEKFFLDGVSIFDKTHGK